MENLITLLSKPDNVPIVGMMVMVFFFLWLGMRQALRNDIILKAGEYERIKVKPEDKVHVWPNLIRLEFLAIILVMIILTVWSITIDAPLEGPANPTRTPNPSKAPWYFLGLQEMLVYFDPWIAGVVLPVLIVIGLILIPYLDVNPKGNGYYSFKDRKFAIITFCFGFILLWVLLIIVGTFLRGPGWNFFLPWEKWDPHKVVAITNINLSEKFGIQSYLWGSIFGGSVLAGFYSLGFLFYLWKGKKNETIQKLGKVRYSIVAFLFLTMMGLLIKIFLRLVMNIQYVWVTPWFNV
jgi:hypothetical protein